MKNNKLPFLRNTQYVTRPLVQSFTLSLILLLAALLRFYQLSGQSLWADEGNSVALARRSFVEIARRTAFDIHPPLYYWLLKIWIFIFGDSEIGLRSLSVVLGVGLVYLIGRLGARLFSRRVGLIAAFIAALSPLQVYYSQEARMYMLLTFLSSLTVLTALCIFERYETRATKFASGEAQITPWTSLLYVVTVTAGLYTHYAYPLIILAVNLTAVAWFGQPNPPLAPRPSPLAPRPSPPAHWLILQLMPLLLYLPWLPTAWRQVTTWPSEKEAISLREIFEQISNTLLFGLSWPFDLGLIPPVGLGLALLIIPGFILSRGRSKQPHLALTLLYLWLLLPITLTAIIFSPAFLKFLLVAAPPLALLLAGLIDNLTKLRGSSSARIAKSKPNRGFGNPLGVNMALPKLPAFWRRQAFNDWPGYLAGGALLVTLSIGSVISLFHYYTNPTYARDDYRGIVNFIKAVSDAGDAVILNAEGQQDVFNYYYEREPSPSSPVYPLPRQRPLDAAATLSKLQNIAKNADKIFAVYWATQQADPNGLIEGWLDSHLFKATDWWYGHVRLVSYASPQTSLRANLTPVDYRLGQHIRLTGYALSSTQFRPGDILQLALKWETDTPLTNENYTVFVQVLDQANHLVGQRDAQPLTATSNWPAGEPVSDAHGVFIEPGTPPGTHRLILGLYNSETGQRLPVIPGDESNENQARDFIELAEVEITRPTTPLPREAFDIRVPLNTPLLEITLLGYDLYKLGHRSTPTTPLHPGDPVHLVAYWTPHQPIQSLENQLTIQVVTYSREATSLLITSPLAGVDYPIQEWSEGEIIRAQYDFLLDNLKPGIYRLALTLNSKAGDQSVAVTKPFRVE